MSWTDEFTTEGSEEAEEAEGVFVHSGYGANREGAGRSLSCLANNVFIMKSMWVVFRVVPLSCFRVPAV